MGFFSRGSDQRYQQHKDALDAAARLAQKYAANDFSRLPVELRADFSRRLENLRYHLENTAVPAELGDKATMTELLEDLTPAQMVDMGRLSHASRASFRATFANGVMQTLVEMTADKNNTRSTFPDMFREALTNNVKVVEDEVLPWLSEGGLPGMKFSRAQAEDIVARANALLGSL